MNPTKAVLPLAVCLVSPFYAAHSARAQTPDPKAAYENKNQVDPKPLKLNAIDGTIHDPGKIAFPSASILLFTDQGHTLVESVKSDANGHFAFGKIKSGPYRIVAKVDGLCTANIPVVVESSLTAHHKLEIVMQPQGLDTCSYAIGK